ncbi:ABC transporter substrate-binding protein [Paenibacillus oleatilyticus]|uniref:ABC transporter substrate-binding protein n=1 Tax=Paenibacillus oleatilyticus TaxID=2594886 RepID=A0ABV4V7F7_9BACL
MKPYLYRAAFPRQAAVILTLAVVTAGCGNAQSVPASGDKTAAGDAGAVPGGKTFELKLMDWQGQNPTYQAAYDHVIQEYMKLHPNVKIEHIYQPLANNGYDKLLDTQFISHKAPDAMQLSGDMINKYTNQGYIINMEGYLNQPTPYSEGKKWIDTFVGGEASFLEAKIGNRFGVISFIPVDGGPGIAENRPFYYNKDLLQKAGVTDVPKTWKQFIEACKKLKDAGITPVAADKERFVNWINLWTSNQFAENYASRFFDAKYDNIKELYATKRSIAALTGKIDRKDPILNAHIDLIKEFSQYWQDGWAGTGEQAAQQLFMYQKAAFLLDGNWNYGYYKDNIKDFAWDVMPFPVITKETSSYAEEAFPKGASTLVTYGWGLNKDLEKDSDKLKVVVDFFHFATSKEVQNKFVDTAMTNSPVDGVRVPDVMKPFMETERNKLRNPNGNTFFLEAEPTARVAASQQFYTGRIDKEQYLTLLEENVRKSTTKKAKDQLDDMLGLPNAMAAVEKQIAELESAQAAQILIDTKKKSLEMMKLQLELYKKYAEPALK